MHQKLQALTHMVKELKGEILLDRSVKNSTLLECRHALSDIYLVQALTLVSSACRIDHKAALQATLIMHGKNCVHSKRPKCLPFWASPEVQAWNRGERSSLIAIQATFRNRPPVRDPCANIVQQLRDAGVAVLWILKPRDNVHYSSIEVLKSLIYQALALEAVPHTESKLSFRLRQYQDACSGDDYASLLGACIQNFKLIYVIVEASAMEPTSASECQIYLRHLSCKLSELDDSGILKIMIVSYGPEVESSKEEDSVSLKVRRVSPRRSTPVPSNPLQDNANTIPSKARRRIRGSAIFCEQLSKLALAVARIY